MNRNERITFQEKVVTGQDAYNQDVFTWQNLTADPTMWAQAIPRTGNEDFRGDQKSGFQRYGFKILHRKDLDVQMRLNWDSRFWGIRSIETIHKEGRNKELLITAEWRQGQYQ